LGIGDHLSHETVRLLQCQRLGGYGHVLAATWESCRHPQRPLLGDGPVRESLPAVGFLRHSPPKVLPGR
jgi:hypothetical protein